MSFVVFTGKVENLWMSGYPLVSLFIQHSSTLRWLDTDDFTGALARPTCSILSSSLTRLILHGSQEVERFTKQQEDALVLLTSLENLKFIFFRSLLCLPAGLHRLGNLKTSVIFHCNSLRSLPDDGLPSSLQVLYWRKSGNNELRMACKNYIRDQHPGIKLRI